MHQNGPECSSQNEKNYKLYKDEQTARFQSPFVFDQLRMIDLR